MYSKKLIKVSIPSLVRSSFQWLSPNNVTLDPKKKSQSHLLLGLVSNLLLCSPKVCLIPTSQSHLLLGLVSNSLVVILMKAQNDDVSIPSLVRSSFQFWLLVGPTDKTGPSQSHLLLGLVSNSCFHKLPPIRKKKSQSHLLLGLVSNSYPCSPNKNNLLQGQLFQP